MIVVSWASQVKIANCNCLDTVSSYFILGHENFTGSRLDETTDKAF